MAEQRNPAPASPLESATAWYLGLIERESAQAGRQATATKLAEHLILTVAGGQPAAAGAAMSLAVNSKLSDCSVRLNAVSGETISWYLDFLATGGNESMPGEEALALATEIAQTPAEAVVSTSGYETTAGRTIFRARWAHVVAGVPVEGDYIEVLINGRHRKAFALSKVWRQPRVGKGAQEL